MLARSCLTRSILLFNSQPASCSGEISQQSYLVAPENPLQGQMQTPEV